MTEKKANFDKATELLERADYHFTVAETGDGQFSVSMSGNPMRMYGALARGIARFAKNSAKEPGAGIEMLMMVFKEALSIYAGKEAILVTVSEDAGEEEENV